jgi:Rieske Fe-S protein
MTHDEDTHQVLDDTTTACGVEQAPCPGRRAMLGCAVALTVAQFLGTSEAEAAVAGQWTGAGAPTAFKVGKPVLVKLVHSKVPVFITRLSTTKWQCLYAVCTHAVNTLDLAPSHPNYAFHCSRHGAKFTKDGAVFQGPARRALVKLPIKIAKGAVVVNVAGFV